jgi:hypothetical protein
MTEDKSVAAAKERQRIINAYHSVFGTPDGKVVLAHLHKYFRTDRPAFERNLQPRFDAIAAAIRDGQREVLLFIEHKLGESAVPDGDVTAPDVTVVR